MSKKKKGKKAEEVAPEEQVEQTESSQEAYLFKRLMELEERLAEMGAPEEVDMGVPPPARKDRTHITIWVNPFNQVMREVPENYRGPMVIHAWKNHQKTRLIGSR